MRKILFAIATVALASCGGQKQQEVEVDPTSLTRDSLIVALANQDSLLSLMNDVANGMSQIKQLENILNSTTDLTAESQDRRQQIRDDMAAIQQTLLERRNRLEELEKKLKASNYTNSTLRQSIETLKQQIADQESTIESLRTDLANANIHIEKLTASVDSLNTTVAEVNEQRQQAEQTAERLTDELNTCYYAIGSKGELKDHNLIETGFLRKTKILPSDFEQSYFTQADKRTLTTINTLARKAKVITNQPADSYEIVDSPDGVKLLKITNPTRFWNQSNFLIIQVD